MDCALLIPDVYEGELPLREGDNELSRPAVSGESNGASSTSMEQLAWHDQLDRIRAVFGLAPGQPLPQVSPDSLWQYATYLRLYMDDVEWLEGTFVSENGFRTQGEFRIARDEKGDLDQESGYGVICQLETHPDEVIEVPLSQVQMPRGSPYFELVEDYRLWFHNL